MFSFKNHKVQNTYISLYEQNLQEFKQQQAQLVTLIEKTDLHQGQNLESIHHQIAQSRTALKAIDFWLRYLEPTQYKGINGPLPVEWETEVFEKFEKPYKREGAGLTLASLYLDETTQEKAELLRLIHISQKATQVYLDDSITTHLHTYHHFYLCNRLFLLNLAAIYTTGFECPNTDHVIPELETMLTHVNRIYLAFNESFPKQALPSSYLHQYQQTIRFVHQQPKDYVQFDHFNFIKNFVNPLFIQNQELIRNYQVVSKSNVDYALNKRSTSIFDKSLYSGQNTKGVFHRIKDTATLAEIDRIGKLLFYDPILSGNNQRSCASCHQPTEYFTDTNSRSSLQFNFKGNLDRNTPSLINVGFNHLIMMDGQHISLQHQTKGVIFNPIEMGGNEKEVLEKLLSCKEYNTSLKKLVKLTPQEPEINMEHVSSSLTHYYSKFSQYYAPFDDAMDRGTLLDASAQRGFNLFMSKAQCATCHFVPNFNGVKPPYVGSEFEVLGVPNDNSYASLSPDLGRYKINPAVETKNAFRTGSIRNATFTKPYMHNGSLKDLDALIDFYDGGGGAGRGLQVENQTLSSDSLHLSTSEKADLKAFINSLNENITFEAPPLQLPASKHKHLNSRKVGGIYWFKKMNKHSYKALALVAISAMAACSTSKYVAHDFPKEMAAPIKVEYIKLYDKGQILYNMNCDKCHTKVVKGKRLVPDFSPEQLKGYELRVLNPQHESGLPEENITAEELGHVMTFLTYKKKNKR